jgi:hypothetical protein
MWCVCSGPSEAALQYFKWGRAMFFDLLLTISHTTSTSAFPQTSWLLLLLSKDIQICVSQTRSGRKVNQIRSDGSGEFSAIQHCYSTSKKEQGICFYRLDFLGKMPELNEISSSISSDQELLY